MADSDSAPAPPHRTPTVATLIYVCRDMADTFAKNKANMPDHLGPDDQTLVFLAHYFWWLADVRKYLEEPPLPFNPEPSADNARDTHEKIAVRMRQLGDLLEAEPGRMEGIAQLVRAFTQTMRNAIRIDKALAMGEKAPKSYETKLAATMQQQPS